MLKRSGSGMDLLSKARSPAPLLNLRDEITPAPYLGLERRMASGQSTPRTARTPVMSMTPGRAATPTIPSSGDKKFEEELARQIQSISVTPQRPRNTSDLHSPDVSPHVVPEDEEVTIEQVVHDVIEYLEKNKHIHINISGDGLGDECIVALSEALLLNPSVTDIDVSGNDLTIIGFNAIFDLLKGNNRIRHLVLSSNQLGPTFAAKLGELLLDGYMLSSLDIGNTGLPPQGAVALARSLHTHSYLHTLRLWDNSIGSDGVAALAALLRQPASALTCLDVSSAINPADFPVLAEAVLENRKLLELNICSNSLGRPNGPLVVSIVERHPTLEILDAAWNSLGLEVAVNILAAINANPGHRLTSLDMRGNFINENVSRPTKPAERLMWTSVVTDINLVCKRNHRRRALYTTLMCIKRLNRVTPDAIPAPAAALIVSYLAALIPPL
eukprot:TRINITY_DN660_c0_g1_i1.p1 TRINITY_DN660_c0_g1~~TRINITY_DN660_c0_g1_i1.p1  ORF type:complete len:443 (+),score=89.69 TRINITY_DN660_c0_g1_i1:84-1412(+)